MRTRIHAIPVAALLLSPTALAQVPTTPMTNVNQEGIATSLAIANNAYRLTQTIYESALVYRGRQQWREILLRPDTGAFQRDFAAFSRSLTIRMSTQGVPSPELASQTSLSANHGTDLTTMLNGKTVSFPAYTQSGQSPGPFNVAIPLDTPFSIGITGHLLVEIETQREASGPSQWVWFPDAEQWFGRPWTVFASTFGQGCGAGPLGWSASAVGTLRTTMAIQRVPGGPLTHPAVAWLGASNTRWGPLPLPFPLTLVGGQGCFLYTEPSVTFPGMTGGGSAERFTLSLELPREFSLLGKTVFSQSAIFDPAAGNALGIRFSPGARFDFSSPPDPYHVMTLVKHQAPGDVPDIVIPDRAVILGVR